MISRAPKLEWRLQLPRGTAKRTGIAVRGLSILIGFLGASLIAGCGRSEAGAHPSQFIPPSKVQNLVWPKKRVSVPGLNVNKVILITPSPTVLAEFDFLARFPGQASLTVFANASDAYRYVLTCIRNGTVAMGGLTLLCGPPLLRVANVVLYYKPTLSKVDKRALIGILARFGKPVSQPSSALGLGLNRARRPSPALEPANDACSSLPIRSRFR